MRRSYQIILVALALSLGGCSYHLRGTNEDAAAPADYVIKVRGSGPDLSFMLSSALREAGFQIADIEYDWEVRVGEEESALDELTPDTSGSMKYRSRIYTLEYSFRTPDQRSPAIQDEVILVSDQTADGLGELRDDVLGSARSEALRQQAIGQIVQRLIGFISKTVPQTQ